MGLVAQALACVKIERSLTAAATHPLNNRGMPEGTPLPQVDYLHLSTEMLWIRGV
jgi:hypothetical protein